MRISDISVRRPVFATVISLLLVIFGLVSLDRLPIREYPDIDRPVVSVTTRYVGASAPVIETKITQVIEDSIAGIEGILKIESESEDERSQVRIEFDVSRNIDGAANDVRDRVSRVLNDLPDEADPPEILKADASADPIMFINFSSDTMSMLEITDYAERNVLDRFAAVAREVAAATGGTIVLTGSASDRAMAEPSGRPASRPPGVRLTTSTPTARRSTSSVCSRPPPCSGLSGSFGCNRTTLSK